MIINLIVFLSPDWNVSFRSALFRAFAKRLVLNGGKVLCVNRPAFIASDWLMHPERISSLLGCRSVVREGNITIYRPVAFLHTLIAKALPFYGTWQKKYLSSQLWHKAKQEGLDIKTTAWWLSHPFQTLEVNIPDDVFVIYERYDRYDAIPGITPRKAALVRELEPWLLQRADIVITTSQKLYDEVAHYGTKVVLQPNAADYAYFSSAQSDSVKPNASLKKLPKPVIGYLGTIHEATDIDLLLAVAGKRPDWGFLLVGPVQQKEIARSKAFRTLTSLSNVMATGWVDYIDLPSYLCAFDVGIIPYRLSSRFNQYVNPNKLHEYLAMGLPIVASPLPELTSQTRWVHLAATADEFVTGIEAALSKRSESNRLERRSFAQNDDWKQWVDILMPKIDSSMDHKNELWERWIIGANIVYKNSRHIICRKIVDGKQVFTKLVRQGRYYRNAIHELCGEYEYLSNIQPQLNKNSDCLSISKPIAFDQQYGILVTEAIKGVKLSVLCKRAASYINKNKYHLQVKDYFRKTAHWHNEVHKMDATEWPSFNKKYWDRYYRYLSHQCMQLGVIDRKKLVRLDNLWQRYINNIPSKPCFYSRVITDFRPGNIFCDGGAITVLDPGINFRAPQEYSVATFLALTDMLKISPVISNSMIDEYKKEFLSEVSSLSPLNSELLNAFSIVVMLRIAKYSALKAISEEHLNILVYAKWVLFKRYWVNTIGKML